MRRAAAPANIPSGHRARRGEAPGRPPSPPHADGWYAPLTSHSDVARPFCPSGAPSPLVRSTRASTNYTMNARAARQRQAEPFPAIPGQWNKTYLAQVAWPQARIPRVIGDGANERDDESPEPMSQLHAASHRAKVMSHSGIGRPSAARTIPGIQSRCMAHYM